jgi:hypothetical protein
MSTFLSLGFRGWSSVFNFGFRPSHYTFTLKIATAMLAETLTNFQHSMQLIPDSLSWASTLLGH